MTQSEASAAEPARIGLVVPFDFALDREYWSYVSDPVSIHITRTARLVGDVGVELAAAVAEPAGVTTATGSLVDIRPGVVAYACTSGSFVRGLPGEATIRRAMEAAGAREAITTSGALLVALEALGAKRVALLAPYTDDVGALLVEYLAQAGIASASLVSMGLTSDIANVTEGQIMAMAREAYRPDADVLFISCTNLRTFGVIELLERELGIPVLTANQVTMWRCLQVLGTSPSGGALRQRLFQAVPTTA